VPKNALLCTNCGHRSLQWLGRCPECAAWESFVRAAEVSEATIIPIGEVLAAPAERLKTGMAELDRVLGGGLVRGSVVLLAGEPGVGKSTLMLQLAAGVERSGRKVLLVCGEESPDQVAARSKRLGILLATRLTTGTDARSIVGLMSQTDVLLVDSIQTIRDPETSGEPGSVGQVRSCAAQLTQKARSSGTVVVLVGHICKDGSIAGPRALEHLVDVVITFEGDRGQVLRTVRGVKNRFGPTAEIGVFQMGATGLVEVPDASRLFLSQRNTSVAGSAVGCALEGRRPVALEIQTLIVPTRAPVARRVAQGLEPARLGVALAVLDQRAGLKLVDWDVYASVAGGVRAAEPGIDLALALALASSKLHRPVPSRLAAVGEVGLAGDVRAVPGMEARVGELVRLGFTRVVIPQSCPTLGRDDLQPENLINEVVKVGNVRQAIDLLS
jgi:DNA repair protein RadA/Sms